MDDAKMKNFTSCFKEKAFLRFFFRRLKENKTGFYEKHFPFVSPCGKEMNYIRCDDLPIVFTQLVKKDNEDHLLFGHAGDYLSVLFEPKSLCMFPRSGRVYHAGPSKTCGVGLVESKLSIQLSPNFVFNEEEVKINEYSSPTHFKWKEELHKLDANVQELVKLYSRQEN